MHFEVSDETIRQWHADGRFGRATAKREVAETNLSIGDRGAEVRDLQEVLRAKGFDILADGVFGPLTHAIVMDFQAANGLYPDGIVGPATRKKLKMN